MKKTNQSVELTPEQEALIPRYLEEYRLKSVSTRPTDRAKAEDAINRSYEYFQLKKPEIVWETSPFAGAEAAARLATGHAKPSRQEIADQASKASYGSLEACWVCFYAFVAEVLSIEHDGLINIVKDIVEECGAYWTFEDVVVLTDKPVAVKMRNGVLHSEEGKALEYGDGTGVIAINGTRYASLLEASLANKYEKKTD
jgi:hypothetical protein